MRDGIGIAKEDIALGDLITKGNLLLDEAEILIAKMICTFTNGLVIKEMDRDISQYISDNLQDLF